jgi:hypothetical protein
MVMVDEFGEKPSLEERQIEDLVQTAMGESISPSRLLQSQTRTGFPEQEIPGPFTEPLRSNEQPHYLFASESGVVVEKLDNDEGEERLQPAVLMITNQRAHIFTSDDGLRETKSHSYAQLVSVDIKKGWIWDQIIVETSDTRYRIAPDDHQSELEDAVAYIVNKSEFNSEESNFEFESGNYDAAREALADQLSQLQNLKEKLEIKQVLDVAKEGALIGSRKGPKGAAIGFLLGAGYDIWSQVTGDDEPDVDLDDIDPDETANDILLWKKAGGKAVNRGGEMAGAALGAAVSIDKQTSGSELSRQLTDLDLDWVARQLEAGNKQEVAVEVSKTAIEAYSSDIADLLSDDFFEQLTGK